MVAAQEVVLSVIHGAGEETYTVEDLQSMPISEFETETIWTEGKQTFKGVTLKTILDSLDIQGGELTAIAVNDYSVTIPVSDAVDDGPVIAYLQNGEPMSRRDKGPLWIVYPYDKVRAYKTETIYSRSIWQLDRLVVK